jgi:hypothetical protein
MTHTNWTLFNFVLLIADIFGYAVSYLPVRYFKSAPQVPTFPQTHLVTKKPNKLDWKRVLCQTTFISVSNIVKLHGLKIIFHFLLSYRYFQISLTTKKKFQKDLFYTGPLRGNQYPRRHTAMATSLNIVL